MSVPVGCAVELVTSRNVRALQPRVAQRAAVGTAVDAGAPPESAPRLLPLRRREEDAPRPAGGAIADKAAEIGRPLLLARLQHLPKPNRAMSACCYCAEADARPKNAPTAGAQRAVAATGRAARQAGVAATAAAPCPLATSSRPRTVGSRTPRSESSHSSPPGRRLSQPETPPRLRPGLRRRSRFSRPETRSRPPPRRGCFSGAGHRSGSARRRRHGQLRRASARL